MIGVDEGSDVRSRIERTVGAAEQIESIAQLIAFVAEDRGELAISGSAAAIVRLAKVLSDELSFALDDLTPIVRQYRERKGIN